MTREVHAFLSESGCINCGIALDGEVAGGQAPSLAESALAHAAWTVLRTADMQVTAPLSCRHRCLLQLQCASKRRIESLMRIRPMFAQLFL